MPSLIGHGTRELDPGYSVEIDTVDEANWHQILGQFRDASIYQTWPYDDARRGKSRTSHVVVRKHGEAIAAAQVRIVMVPLVGAGIAYVRWGPISRRTGIEPEPQSFRQAIRALRNEYACRTGLVLRLRPLLFHEASSDFASILVEEGYSKVADAPERTLRLDLTKTTEELRAGMRQHWRRYLKVAEKGGLEILEGTSDALFDEFIGIYRELVDRKAFNEPNDIRQFRAIQAHLPAALKMKILLCKVDGRLCAGLVCSAVGDTALYLYGATSNAGLKNRGSYLLHWRLIERLKESGITTYDLHGINPVTNPGTYKFKADLCGSNGQDVHFLGQFETCTSPLSRNCVAFGEKLKQVMRALRRRAGHKAAERPAPASSQLTAGEGL